MITPDRHRVDASNAYASALWALDFMHWWAAHFCAGVNFHNKSWLLTDTIYLDTAGNLQANPKAYGIKMFDLGGHGSVEPLTITNTRANSTSIRRMVWARRAIFLSPSSTKRPASVARTRNSDRNRACRDLFRGRGTAGMFLTAPSGNLAATNGLTLGGAAITNNAPWQGHWTSLGTLTNGQCVVEPVPAAWRLVCKLVPMTTRC